MSRNAYLGNDSVWYREDAKGTVVLTTPESPVPAGWQRYQATTVSEVERIWKRIDQQERRAAERMTEAMYNQRKGRLENMRSQLNSRLVAADVSNAERDFIKASLKILDRKEDVLNKHSVYGVAAMQEKSAPLPASVNEVVKVMDAETN